MKKFMIMILFSYILFQPLKSIAADWPGTGSCAGFLQACIDAQADGGSIQVITNAVILTSGTITINKSFVLMAAVGYHPRFRNVVISIPVPSNKKVVFGGFDFEQSSYIDASIGNDSDLSIISNNWSLPDAVAGKREGIYVQSPGVTAGNQTNVLIQGNNIVGEGENLSKAFVTIYHNNIGTINAKIIDNHITVLDLNSANSAIFLNNVTTGKLNAQIVANVIKGGRHQIGMQQVLSGDIDVGIISNLLKRNILDTNSDSVIISSVLAGTFNGVIGNNTIDGAYNTGGSAQTGLDFSPHTTASSSVIKILNNIIVNTTTAYEGPASGTSVNVNSLGFNVFFNHGTISGFALDASDLVSDPQFIKEGVNYALQATSPAIDRAYIIGTNLLYSSGVLAGSPRIDADGLRRYKGPKVDSGAIEWGDRHIFHQTNNAFFNSSAIIDTEFNMDTNAVSIVTAVWNYENLPGAYHDHPIGIFRSNPSWGVINEDYVDLPTNAKFHIFYPYGQDYGGTNLNGLIRWTTPTSTAPGFELGDPVLLNNNAQAGVFASNFWDGSNSPIYNPHSLEVGYQTSNGKWKLANSDGANMPTGAKFFTYNQDASRNVYHHEVSSSNSTGNVTYLDHPLLNGNPCVLPTVTQSTTWFFGPLFAQNPHHIGVFYSQSIGKWAIFNQDLTAIDVTIGSSTTAGGQFNVMVDPQQLYECNSKILFADGFE